MKLLPIEVYEEAKEQAQKERTQYELEIQEVANDFLLENFDLTLEIPLTINARLKRTLGVFKNYQLQRTPICIEISQDLVIHSIIKGDKSELYDVLYHELIHYALFIKRIPHRDNDYEFISTCNNLNVSLTNTISIATLYNRYLCDNGHEIIRKRKFDVSKYRCKCGGHLHHEGEYTLWKK